MPVGGRDFTEPLRPALGTTQAPIQRVQGHFPGEKRPESRVSHPPHLTLRLKKEQNYLPSRRHLSADVKNATKFCNGLSVTR